MDGLVIHSSLISAELMHYICKLADPVNQFWEIFSHKMHFKPKGYGCIMLQEKMLHVRQEMFEALSCPVLHRLQPSYGH